MWSRRSIELLLIPVLLAALAACAVGPRRGAPSARSASAAPHPASQAAPSGPPPVPVHAKREFARALALAAAHNDAAAETQLQTLARTYPRFHTPLIDLGLLYRRDGKLDAAAAAFRQAAARDPKSARAWTELGVTQRLDGKFQDAQRSYTRAIAANGAYAPAYRDRGVLRDLYLDEPAAALADFERYRKLTGKDEPVAMWIAELEHRSGSQEPAGPIPPTAAAVGRPQQGKN
jgi:tetratricopeptide (TPR) repeat protein